MSYWHFIFVIASLYSASSSQKKDILSIEPQPAIADAEVRISCQSEAREFKQMNVTFAGEHSAFTIVYSPPDVHKFTNHSSRPEQTINCKKNPSMEPFSKIMCDSNSLRLFLKATPKLRQMNVRCTIKVYDPYSEGEYYAEKVLDVQWQAKVLSLELSPTDPKEDDEVNVTCEGRAGMSPSKGLVVSGVDSWRDGREYNRMDAEGYYLNSRSRLKRVTAADNGTVIRCSFGNSTKESHLIVNYPPTIVSLLPSSGTTVTVGASVTCSAVGNPPPEVVLSFRSSSTPWSEKARSSKRAEFVLPVGEWDAKCEAENDLNKTEETMSLTVQKIKLDVRLDVPSNMSPEHIASVTCGLRKKDHDLMTLRLLVNDSALVEAFKNNGTKLQHESILLRNVSVDWTSLDDQTFTVSFFPLPLLNGVEMKCEADAPSKSKYGSLTIRPNVTWGPTMFSMISHDRERKELRAFREGNTTFINCTFRLGSRGPYNEIISLSGFGDPSKRTSWRDPKGFLWRSNLWRVTVNRADNGRSLTCSFGSEHRTCSLNVTYAPVISLRSSHLSQLPSIGATVTEGSTVTCSAEGNPPPEVVLSFRSSSTRWSEKARGSKRAEFALPVGQWDAKCEAENDLNKTKKTVSLTVQSPYRVSRMAIVVPLLLLLLLTIVFLFLKYGPQVRSRIAQLWFNVQASNTTPIKPSDRVSNKSYDRLPTDPVPTPEVGTNSSTTLQSQNACEQKQVIYADLDFTNVPESSDRYAPTSPEVGLDIDFEDRVIYSELAACQDLSQFKPDDVEHTYENIPPLRSYN